MSIKEFMGRYKSPKDERLVTETNKVYRKGFMSVMLGFVLCLYYELMRHQVAGVNDIDLSPFSAGEIILFLWFMVTSAACTVVMVRKGFIDETHYGETEKFPADYYFMIAGLSGLSMFVVTALLRAIAEAELLGLGGVALAGDVAVGLFYGFLVYIIAYGTSYLSFRAAKKSRKKVAEQFEE